MAVADILESLQRQLVDMQTQLAFQEDTIAQLNQALAMQQQDLESLKVAGEMMRQQYRELQQQIPDSPAAEDQPPPHY